MQENEEFDEELTELIEFLLEEGALEIFGYDSISDTFTYKITDKCKEVYPELYNTHFEMVNETAQNLWMNGIIDIVFTQGQAIVGVTDDQLDYIKKNINNFQEDERLFLETLLHEYQSREGV